MRSVVIGDSCEKQRETKTTDDTMNEKDTYVWDDAIWIIIENHVTFFCFSFLRGSLTRPDIECTLNAVCIAQRHMVCVSRASETITRPHLIDLRKMCNRRLPVQHSDLIWSIGDLYSILSKSLSSRISEKCTSIFCLLLFQALVSSYGSHSVAHEKISMN